MRLLYDFALSINQINCHFIIRVVSTLATTFLATISDLDYTSGLFSLYLIEHSACWWQASIDADGNDLTKKREMQKCIQLQSSLEKYFNGVCGKKRGAYEAKGLH